MIEFNPQTMLIILLEFFRLHRSLFIVCVAAVAVRFLFFAFFADMRLDYYWEYGELAKNILHGKGYSLWHYVGDSQEHLYSDTANPHISAYMPPAYPLYLLPFMAVGNILFRNWLIYGIQILSVIPTIIFLYEITKILYGKTAALVASWFMGLLPEFIYASTTAGPTLFYHAILLWLMWKLLQYPAINFRQAALFGVVSAGAIYLRGDFALFGLALAILFVKHSGWKKAMLYIAAMSIMLLPWQIRNYIAFNRFIPLTTSAGLNFYRGHNPEFIGSWGDSTIIKDIAAYKNSSDYEIIMSDIYYRAAIKSMRINHKKEIENTLKKMFNLWIINPADNRAFNPAYLIPWLALIILFIIGIFAQNNNYFILKPFFLYWLASTVTSVIYFALPRYQTLLKPTLLPFAAAGALHLWQLLKNRSSVVKRK